jgi:dTDP-4-amino-4,6-dideoxygalactose transaminase
MVRILEHHGLVAVPLDVDSTTLDVDLKQLEAAITPRTRAILVAHMFGSRMEMGPIVDLARRHRLSVFEDGAQAFVGWGCGGHPGSDVAMFSFGPIKTATALGGAVLRVRDAALRSQLEQRQNEYPVQGRWQYYKRLAKYAAFFAICRPRFYGWLVRGLDWLEYDYDRALSNAAHSFAADKFFGQIRRRPSAPLLRMLQRRLSKFEGSRSCARLRRRRMRGDELASILPVGMVIGSQNRTHTYWVLSVRVANRDAVISALHDDGFDATSRSSMIALPAHGAARAEQAPSATWLREVVFLPSCDDMPEHEWQRMVSILLRVAKRPKMEPACELLAAATVSREL